MKIKYLLFIITGLLLSGCKKDVQEVTIKMQLLYNGSPMLTQQNYPYPDGRTFVLTKFSTYLTDLIIESGTASQELEEVRLVNLTETLRSMITSNEGYTIYQGETNLSSIQNLHFNFGLTTAQNKTIPADYPSGHPLAMPGEYWLAWESYIFTKIEGWIDLNNDGMAETGVALHLGSDEAMKSFTFTNLDGTNELTIQIDLARVFEQENKIYDIEANPQIHSLSQLESLQELSKNLEKAISLKTIQ